MRQKIPFIADGAVHMLEDWNNVLYWLPVVQNASPQIPVIDRAQAVFFSHPVAILGRKNSPVPRQLICKIYIRRL